MVLGGWFKSLETNRLCDFNQLEVLTMESIKIGRFNQRINSSNLELERVDKI